MSRYRRHVKKINWQKFVIKIIKLVIILINIILINILDK